MKQYKCKNCGAPVEHSYNHRCPYCHAIFDFNVKLNEIEEVKIEDMRNVELVEIERNHLFNTYRFFLLDINVLNQQYMKLIIMLMYQV